MYSAQTNTTVLLVDDDPSMRQGVRSLLQDYEDVEVVAEAADGIEAIQYVRMLRPHVVLMDISMPEMDGVQATRVIKEEDPETIIIGLGNAEQNTAPKALLRAGASTYLDKRSIVEHLYSTIVQFLDTSTLPSQTANNHSCCDH